MKLSQRPTAIYSRRHKKRQKRLGLCRDCTEPVVQGRTRCAKHLFLAVRATIATHKQRIANHRCWICQVRVRVGTLCPACRVKVNQRVHNGRAQRIRTLCCIECKEPLSLEWQRTLWQSKKHLRCERCNDLATNRRKRKEGKSCT